MSLPLKDVISALTADIQQAEINADVENVYWRNLYDEHEMLREFAPSKVRVREVKVSIPLAIDELDEASMVRPEVTAAQISRIFPADMDAGEVQRYSQTLELHLHRKARHLLSRTLFSEIQQQLKKLVPAAVAEKIDTSPLERLKRDYLATPKQQSQVKVLFRNADIQQVPTDRLIRMEFTIEID